MNEPLTGARRSSGIEPVSDWTSDTPSQTTSLGVDNDSESKDSESFLCPDDVVELGLSPSESSSAESPPLKLERTGVNRQFQPHLFDREKLARDTLFLKLMPFSESVPHWDNFKRCGQNTTAVMWCGDCGKSHVLPYRCSLRWCPVCMPVLAHRRQKLIRLWTNTIKQPKHIVVTARNSSVISRERIRSFSKSLIRLRRSKLFSKVTGGCSSLEMTNEQRGWHLHAHILADVRFIDSGALSVKWGKLVGQDFAIVKVQDARQKDYTSEVCKYVVKGNALASWSGEEALAFVKAFDGIRNFTRFGTLRGRNEFIEECVKGEGAKCKSCKSTSVEMTIGAGEFLRRYKVPSPELT